MTNQSNDILSFLRERKDYILTSDIRSYDLQGLDEITLGKDQAVYVFDITKNKIVYSRGIEDLLGYSAADLSPGLITNYFHPDDQQRMEILIRAALDYATNNRMIDLSCKLFLNSRVRHKAGHYVHIFRQTTIFNTNVRGEMAANFSILSNIDSIPFSDVAYALHANGESVEAFEETVRRTSFRELTVQEKQVLADLKSGLSNTETSEKLNISENVVEELVQSMLKKTACRNVTDLITQFEPFLELSS